MLVTLGVPAMPGLGLAEVATLELRYVALPDLVEQTISLPIHVNVVPGDEAAGRIKNPRVDTEVLFQRAQEAKRRAAERLSAGDTMGARAEYQAATAALAMAPPGDAELEQEAEILADLDRQVELGETSLAAKASWDEHARKARQRGRGV